MCVLVVVNYADSSGVAFASRPEKRFVNGANAFNDPDAACAGPAGIPDDHPPAIYARDTGSPRLPGDNSDSEPDSVTGSSNK